MRASTGRRTGIPALPNWLQGTLCNILNAREIKPHKVRYYLERRDPEFKQKMAEVLCVYREVRLIKETRPPQTRSRAMRWRSSPMTRSPASRRLALQRRLRDIVAPALGSALSHSPRIGDFVSDMVVLGAR